MFLYEIVNLVNGKKYIGQTIQSNPNLRWLGHKKLLRKNCAANKHLQNAWNKYGELNFVFRVLRKAQSLSELNLLETKYIRRYKTLNKNFGYNIFSGGRNSPMPIQIKIKIAKAITGLIRSSNSRLKMSIAKRPNGFGNVLSPNRKVHSISNLSAFCRKYHLGHSKCLYRVITGERKSHKGWTLCENK